MYAGGGATYVSGIQTGLKDMSLTNCEFVPVVPFASYSEYEDMQDSLIREYQAMVVRDAERTTLWCDMMGGGVEWIVRSGWLYQGEDLFLKFTKGQGKEWCNTMNTMVVHALHTAVRVLVQTRSLMFRPLRQPLTANLWDKITVTDLLKRETINAIADRRESPNNMYDFEFQNFRFVFDDNNESGGEFLPVGQVQAMNLAFAMLAHPRLGRAAAGRILGYDTIKLVLAQFSEPLK